MTTVPERRTEAVLRMEVSQFWSGDLGLTLTTISLVVLIFIVTPLREAGLPGRIFFDLLMVTLMIFGALVMEQRRIISVLIVSFVVLSAVFLAIARMHPSPTLGLLGSILATITLLLYIRIVLLVMFRGGPVTWSRIQGGVSAYLLLGMAWASVFQTLEEFHPGSFTFVTQPQDMDQLISKMTYFSFSTLTTIGGQIIPATPMARSLYTAEATIGQLFPAILIGALVAMAMRPRGKA
jgi:Ion channel